MTVVLSSSGVTEANFVLRSIVARSVLRSPGRGTFLYIRASGCNSPALFCSRAAEASSVLVIATIIEHYPLKENWGQALFSSKAPRKSTVLFKSTMCKHWFIKKTRIEVNTVFLSALGQ
jgi:hypothetical protein